MQPGLASKLPLFCLSFQSTAEIIGMPPSLEICIVSCYRHGMKGLSTQGMDMSAMHLTGSWGFCLFFRQGLALQPSLALNVHCSLS